MPTGAPKDPTPVEPSLTPFFSRISLEDRPKHVTGIELEHISRPASVSKSIEQKLLWTKVALLIDRSVHFIDCLLGQPLSNASSAYSHSSMCEEIGCQIPEGPCIGASFF